MGLSTENNLEKGLVSLFLSSKTSKHEEEITHSLTHLHSERPKEAWQYWEYLAHKSIYLKIIEGEMLIRSQTTTLLQIFYELSLYSQVIFKSMKVADDTF